MITAGIDVGASSVKAVIMDGDNILAKFKQPAEGEEEQVIKDAFAGALKEAGKSKDDLDKIIATGAGAKNVDFADDVVTDISSGARGAVFEVPASRTVVDTSSALVDAR